MAKKYLIDTKEKVIGISNRVASERGANGPNRITQYWFSISKHIDDNTFVLVLDDVEIDLLSEEEKSQLQDSIDFDLDEEFEID